MTHQDTTDNPGKTIPLITTEEDTPTISDNKGQMLPQQVNDSLGKTDDLNTELTRFRFKTGKKVLFVSMIAMGVLVITDIFTANLFTHQSELLKNAFEAFKLITMTVLGYIFGSNGAKSN